jgi:hypothetical protein
VTGSRSDGEARLTTFKTALETRANSMGEDLERSQRFKRPLPVIGSDPLRTIRQKLRRGPREQEPQDQLRAARFRRNPRDQEVLNDYNRLQLRAQQSFARAATSAHAGTLMLEEFYAPTPRLEQPYADQIATMLAARAESNGRALLSGSEGKRIANALERTGRTLLSAGLPHLAEEAFDQAADIHSRFKNRRAEDQCAFLKSRAHGKTYPWWRPMRLILALSGVLFGYGYKPLRLLIWIAVVIAGFTVYMLHLPRDPGATHGDALFMAIQNFVNPMGLGDAKFISPKWEHALEVETYTGDILRNIFFVLLIRRWFRL